MEVGWSNKDVVWLMSARHIFHDAIEITRRFPLPQSKLLTISLVTLGRVHRLLRVTVRWRVHFLFHNLRLGGLNVHKQSNAGGSVPLAKVVS